MIDACYYCIELVAMAKDISTEEKIKQAAEKIFMQKGYSATRTRDIAEAAGINIALLNYYFRSKEKLFHQIMLESLAQFFGTILTIFNDEQSSLIEKLEKITEAYMNKLMASPDLPMFILSEIRNEPEVFLKQVAQNQQLHNTVLFRQLGETLGQSTMKDIDPVHIIVNFLGMMVFPFLAKPILQQLTGMEEGQFLRLVEERKRFIPLWIESMVK